jgi:hypothetical protein
MGQCQYVAHEAVSLVLLRFATHYIAMAHYYYRLRYLL